MGIFDELSWRGRYFKPVKRLEAAYTELEQFTCEEPRAHETEMKRIASRLERLELGVTELLRIAQKNGSISREQVEMILPPK